MSSKCLLKPLVIHSGAKNVQNWVPTWAPTWGERIDFFALETLLAPSWGHLAPQVAPRPSKRPSWDHLGAVLEPSWAHFGTILGPSWGHVGIDNLPSWPSNGPINQLAQCLNPQRGGGWWAQPVDIYIKNSNKICI